MDNATLAAWAPTVVTALTCVFFAGVLWTKLQSHDEKIKDHDERFEKQEERIAAQEMETVKINSWRDGYNAGKAQPHPAGSKS